MEDVGMRLPHKASFTLPPTQSRRQAGPREPADHPIDAKLSVLLSAFRNPYP